MKSFPRVERRRVSCMLVTLVFSVVAAVSCSSGGSESTSQPPASTGPTASFGEYCAVVREGADLLTTTKGANVDQARLADLFRKAINGAPAELQPAYAQVFSNSPGAAEAQKKIDDFNKSNCGVDSEAVRLAQPSATRAGG